MVKKDISINNNFPILRAPFESNSWLEMSSMSFRDILKECNVFYDWATWDQVLKKYKVLINQVDFLNIDVEAHDYEVLKGIDFVKIKPKIICIEIENFSSKLNFEKINNC